MLLLGISICLCRWWFWSWLRRSLDYGTSTSESVRLKSAHSWDAVLWTSSYGISNSWIGKLQITDMNAIDALKMNTALRAIAHDDTAAAFSSGSSVRITSVECRICPMTWWQYRELYELMERRGSIIHLFSVRDVNLCAKLVSKYALSNCAWKADAQDLASSAE